MSKETIQPVKQIKCCKADTKGIEIKNWSSNVSGLEGRMLRELYQTGLEANGGHNLGSKACS